MSVINPIETERTMKELFGQRLREQRQNQGLTMEQLAEKANLSSYHKRVVFIDRSPAECYNSFRVLWIGEKSLP